MLEGSVEEAGGGIGSGILSLFMGALATVIFNSFVQGQDFFVVLLVLVGFGGCVIYGEVVVAMPNGVAFGTGMLMTAFASLNGWPIGLGMAATIVSLVKYGVTKPDGVEGAAEEIQQSIDDFT